MRLGWSRDRWLILYPRQQPNSRWRSWPRVWTRPVRSVSWEICSNMWMRLHIKCRSSRILRRIKHERHFRRCWSIWMIELISMSWINSQTGWVLWRRRWETCILRISLLMRMLGWIHLNRVWNHIWMRLRSIITLSKPWRRRLNYRMRWSSKCRHSIHHKCILKASQTSQEFHIKSKHRIASVRNLWMDLLSLPQLGPRFRVWLHFIMGRRALIWLWTGIHQGKEPVSQVH